MLSYMEYRDGRFGRGWYVRTPDGWTPRIAGGIPAAAAIAIPAVASVVGGYLAGRGGGGGTSRQLNRLLTSPFESGTVQRVLPPYLRSGVTSPFLQSGIEGIGRLIQFPGRLSPDVAEAILPRLAAESETIAQNFRGIGAQQQGAAARGNVPVSIRGALESALNVAQERAQRGARREALSESEQLRRQDLSQTYALLDTILQFLSSARGQAVQGLGGLVQSQQQRQAGQLAFTGSLLSSLSDAGLFSRNPSGIAGTAQAIPSSGFRVVPSGG